MCGMCSRTICAFLVVNIKTIGSTHQDAIQISRARNFGRTLAIIIFGKELRLPSYLVFGYVVGREFQVKDCPEGLQQRLLTIHPQVRNKIKIDSDRMNTSYDIRTASRTSKEGEQVL